MFNSTPPDSGSQTIYSVSKLNVAVRRLLEGHFGQIWLVGEVSNFSAPASGHWYFTLKDERAQVRCAMFKNANRNVQIPVASGKQVLVRAKPALYEPRGDYQLIVEHLEDAGVGLLQQQFEALKTKLAAEGLFASEHKRALPEQIRKVGIITSPTGAALHDVLSVLARRDPSVEVIVYPTQVQGENAPGQLLMALNDANRRNEVDVLLLTRGGGSLEDLWCFNDETLARAVFTSRLPVVAAVGHEVDFSIADFVADLRAATPSAAAELVSRDRSHLRQQQQQMAQRLWRAWRSYLQQLQQQQSYLQQRLQPLHPQQQLQQQQQRLDDNRLRLQQSWQRALTLKQQHQQNLQQRLWQKQPGKDVQRLDEKLQGLIQRQQRAMTQLLQQKQQQAARHAHALQLVSPLETLSRGYSISFTESGEVIKSAGQVKPGATIRNKLADGELLSQVISSSSEKN
ncbi:exodeoxyribonuclease VII large subunit [Aliidiomarina minuta]|uniref:exodeoxyribonuclease VII large subunit n=1 Tax=Aliidiomarina minuta TaxID=880057 RepID=UPI001F547494|nr:exodeoxyribonuclease VII large subunit [Aliidiomarina minuta]